MKTVEHAGNTSTACRLNRNNNNNNKITERENTIILARERIESKGGGERAIECERKSDKKMGEEEVGNKRAKSMQRELSVCGRI